MDSVDMILEDSPNIERINRELSVITPYNLAYVSLSRKASELNSKLMAKNLGSIFQTSNRNNIDPILSPIAILCCG